MNLKTIDAIAAELQGYDPKSLRASDVGLFLERLVEPVAQVEQVGVFDALQRVLADDIVSPISVPPHDNSAMDGFAFDGAALRADAPLTLTVVGTALAGEPWQGTVGPGEALKIMTGAVMPPGADTVVMQEQTRLEGDRVIIGADSERAHDVLSRLYRPINLREVPIVNTSLVTAEITKYAANAFLAMKITYINEVADMCEKAGADVHDVARGIVLDGRIGRKFLHPGPGYGGSCFPKDTLAFARTARELATPLSLVETTVEVNDARKRAMAQRVVDACGGSVASKTIAVLGLTFKPNTDDMRESPSLEIVPALQAAGAEVRAFDPEGMGEAAPLLPGTTFCEDAYGTMAGAACLVIVTEWSEFRALDLKRVKALLAAPLVVDLRNCYDPATMAQAGFAYHSIGRPSVDGRVG